MRKSRKKTVYICDTFHNNKTEALEEIIENELTLFRIVCTVTMVLRLSTELSSTENTIG